MVVKELLLSKKNAAKTQQVLYVFARDAILHGWLSHSGAETGIFRENQINIMAADDLATEGARASAAMILIMQNNCFLVFHDGGFQLPVSSQYREMIVKAKSFFIIPKINSVQELTLVWPVHRACSQRGHD